MELCSFDGNRSAEATGLWNRLHASGGEGDSAILFAGIDWHGMLAAGAFRMGCSLAARKHSSEPLETDPDSTLQSQHSRIAKMVLQGTASSYWNFRVFESARAEARHSISPADAQPNTSAPWSSFQFERPRGVGEHSDGANARSQAGHPLDIGMLEGCAAVAASRTIALSSKDRAVLKVLGARCWAWMQRIGLAQGSVVQADGTQPSQPQMVSSGPDEASPQLQPPSHASTDEASPQFQPPSHASTDEASPQLQPPSHASTQPTGTGTGLPGQQLADEGDTTNQTVDISVHSCYWLWDGTAGIDDAIDMHNRRTAGATLAPACHGLSSDSTTSVPDGQQCHSDARRALGTPDGPPVVLSPAQQACLAVTVLAAGNKLPVAQPHDTETKQTSISGTRLAHDKLQHDSERKRAITGIDVLLPPLRPDIYNLVAGSQLEGASSSTGRSSGRGSREKIAKPEDSNAHVVQTRSYLLHCARIVPIKRPWLFVEAAIRAKRELRAAGIKPALCAPGCRVESRKSPFNESEADQQFGSNGEVPTTRIDVAATNLCVEHRHSGGHDSLRDCLVGHLLAHFPTAHIITQFLDAQGLASLLRESVAYVHAAAQEPYGMAVVEAAAFGAVPIVSTSTAAVTKANLLDCDDASKSGSGSGSSQTRSQPSVTGYSIGARVGQQFEWGDLVLEGVQRNQIERVGLDTPQIGATELVRPRCGESIGVAIGSGVPESIAVARLAESIIHEVLADGAALSAGGRQAESTTGGLDSYRSRGLARATAWSVEEHAAGLLSLLELTASGPSSLPKCRA